MEEQQQPEVTAATPATPITTGGGLPKMVANNPVDKGVKQQTTPTYYATNTNNKEVGQKRPRTIRITECLSQPCAVYYTDTLSQSILIICENPKHNKGVEKVGGEIANLNLNQSTNRVSAITFRRSPK